MGTRLTLLSVTLAPLLAFVPARAPQHTAPGPVGASGQEASAAPAREARSEDIYFAVLEGAFRDGPSQEVVDAILEVDGETGWPLHFIYSCPICMPAFNALRTYRESPTFLGSKIGAKAFGTGLPEELRVRLLAPSAAECNDAIQELVARWVAERMDLLRLTTAERRSWESMMDAWREKGMAYLESYQAQGITLYQGMKTCPLCEGANDAFRLPTGGGR